MSDVVRNVACADPVRLRVLDEVAQFFLRPEPNSPGTCKICGATGIMVDSSKRCLAQAALAQHRRKPLEKDAFVYGAEENFTERKGSQSIIASFGLLLVEPNHTITNARVIPSHPLPDHIDHRVGINDGEFFDYVVREAKAPYVLASFDKKSDMPMVETTNPNRIILNGKQTPTVLDRGLIFKILDLMDEFGIADVKLAAKVRTLANADKAAARLALAKLAKNAPDLKTRIAEVPHSTVAEILYASKIYYFRNPEVTVTKEPSGELTDTPADDHHEDDVQDAQTEL